MHPSAMLIAYSLYIFFNLYSGVVDVKPAVQFCFYKPDQRFAFLWHH